MSEDPTAGDLSDGDPPDNQLPTSRRLLVCVGPSPSSAKLVRAASRIATSLQAQWLAVHVETANDSHLAELDRQQLAHTLHLAEQLGAQTAILTGHDVAEEVLAYARGRGVTQIIVGKPRQPRWREWLRGSAVYKITRQCGEIDVYVISGEMESVPKRSRLSARRRTSYAGYLGAMSSVAISTGIGFLMLQHFAAANIIMVYLLGVVVVALRFGRGPSMAASVLSVAAFDFFFIRPYLTFAVEDAEYLLTFAVMLATGAIISSLTARLTFQVESARGRERRTAALYAMSRDLVHAQSISELLDTAARHISSVFDADVYLLVPAEQRDAAVSVYDRQHRADRGIHLWAQSNSVDPLGTMTALGAVQLINLGPAKQPLNDRDLETARWVFENGEAAGFGTDTLRSSTALFVPMPNQDRRIGVLGVRPRRCSILAPDQVRLLETFAGQLALAIVRIRSSDETQAVRLEAESERMRSSLLSAVSHDLRTPLAAIAGASSTLVEGNGALDARTRHELAISIYDEVERLNRLVSNLLDMTRLEAGALQVRKEWSSLDELVAGVLQRLNILHGREVITDIQPDLPLVQLDELLIHQVLTNLVENATRYTPVDSPIEITTALDEGQLKITVGDRGPGLPPELVERVFEKFYRVAAVGTRTSVGLGLTICRGIVELHGGRIWAENRIGGGVMFQFTVPQPQHPPGVPPE